MKLETHFDKGVIVYPVGRTYTTDKFSVRAAMPINFISVEVDKDDIITEIYGCEETAELYTLDDVFPTRGEAQAYAERLNKELAE